MAFVFLSLLEGDHVSPPDEPYLARANGTACRLLKVGDDLKIDKAKFQNMSTSRATEWSSTAAPTASNASADFNSAPGGVSLNGLSLGWLGRGRRKSARSVMSTAAVIEQAEDGLQLQLQGRISSMIMLQRETAEILSPGLARRINNETLTANGDAFILLEVFVLIGRASSFADSTYFLSLSMQRRPRPFI